MGCKLETKSRDSKNNVFITPILLVSFTHLGDREKHGSHKNNGDNGGKYILNSNINGPKKLHECRKEEPVLNTFLNHDASSEPGKQLCDSKSPLQ